MKNFRSVWCVLLILVVIFAAGCSKKAAQSNGTETKAEATEEPSTGYPSGEVQRIYVFYSGTLYVYNAEFTPVEDEKEITEHYGGYEYAGDISLISNKEIPDEEFEASHLEIGDKVYEKDGSVIVYSSGRVLEMELSE